MTNAKPVENHPCNGCEQLDDHPMIHVWGAYVSERDAQGRAVRTTYDPSFHFDCLPTEYEAALVDSEGKALPQHAVTVAAIKAARDGKHGDALRRYIHSRPSDNDVDLGEHEVVPNRSAV